METRLAVAVDELYPEPAVGALFAAFAERFPHVELELSFPSTRDIAGLVLEGKADLECGNTTNTAARRKQA